MALDDKKKARETLEAGLTYVPNAKGLITMQNELGGEDAASGSRSIAPISPARPASSPVSRRQALTRRPDTSSVT